ncbi:hypothetical protein [Bailinhaonella thermotolerans]|uniref:hypothetical protein n=1 Tax=Bailinhaonella thermotolerans TaxID=1070861 RepID=UPI00192A52B4|nr:hypothetical protein [Bailinhaonella thermotolerans]
MSDDLSVSLEAIIAELRRRHAAAMEALVYEVAVLGAAVAQLQAELAEARRDGGDAS